jgi:hypothetical protein
MRFVNGGTPRFTALAFLFYLLLLDAAIETFARRSPVRWWVVVVTALYLGGTAELRRRRHPLLLRLGWPRTARTSFFVLFGLIMLTAWLPSGLQNGLGVLGLRTSTLLSFISAAAVTCSAVMVVRLNDRHPAIKWVVVAAAAYGVIAFLLGTLAGTAFGALFHGESFWTRLPVRWLQGAYIGALVIAFAVLVNGLTLLRRTEDQRWGLQQAAALAMALVVVVSGIRASDTRDSTGRGTLAEYPVLEQFAPKDRTTTIKAVSLSSKRGGTAFDPTKVGTRFADGVEHVVLWYRWQGAEKGRRVDIQWSKDGEIVLEQWEVLQQPSGNASWYLEKEGAGPLPVGRYQVTLVENGARVTEIPFQIAKR